MSNLSYTNSLHSFSLTKGIIILTEFPTKYLFHNRFCSMKDKNLFKFVAMRSGYNNQAVLSIICRNHQVPLQIVEKSSKSETNSSFDKA